MTTEAKFLKKEQAKYLKQLRDVKYNPAKKTQTKTNQQIFEENISDSEIEENTNLKERLGLEESTLNIEI